MGYKIRLLRATWIAALAIALSLPAACTRRAGEMQVLRVDPNFGGVFGGKSIRIIGRNLRLDVGYTVHFGKRQSPRVSLLNDSTLVAVTPRAVSAGVVDIIVKADHGPSFRINQAFKYIDQGGTLLP